jgi:hypothetical protein
MPTPQFNNPREIQTQKMNGHEERFTVTDRRRSREKPTRSEWKWIDIWCRIWNVVTKRGIPRLWQINSRLTYMH